ncbi:hypothetical protein [Agarilytica rhodophyticola]|uniref:hypothetical protein n=1 Tax=Agarilytica rhodophyticola TaxID=1737490 RepID=UPI000B3442C3|nr:hypothetical protein [Agarilytica rhodophyticola]
MSGLAKHISTLLLSLLVVMLLILLLFTAKTYAASQVYDMEAGASYSDVDGEYQLDLTGLWESNGPISDRSGKLHYVYTTPDGNVRKGEYSVRYNSIARSADISYSGTYRYQIELCYEYMNQTMTCELQNWSTTVYVTNGTVPTPTPLPSPIDDPTQTFSINQGAFYSSDKNSYFIQAPFSLWPGSNGPVVRITGDLYETYYGSAGQSSTHYEIDRNAKITLKNKPDGVYKYTLKACVYWYGGARECNGPGYATHVIVDRK